MFQGKDISYSCGRSEYFICKSIEKYKILEFVVIIWTSGSDKKQCNHSYSRSDWTRNFRDCLADDRSIDRELSSAQRIQVLVKILLISYFMNTTFIQSFTWLKPFLIHLNAIHIFLIHTNFH